MKHPRSRAALVGGLAAAAILLTAGCTAATGTSGHVATVPKSLSVEGYGVDDAATLTALARDRSALDIVGISGVNLTTGGAGVAASSQEALKIAAKAKADGLKSELLVTNIDQQKGDFSNDLVTAMLGSEENRSFVIAGLASEIAHGGYHGVQLDFESMSQADEAGLVTFVSELRSTLPSTASISMTLPAVSAANQYPAQGFDLERLDPLVSRYVLMAYDEHGTGFSQSGPVGGLPWMKQAVTALTGVVAAKKIDLGVAGYGYSWTTSGSGGVITTAQARKKAGGAARWVSAQGEWTAKLSNGTILWWSDGQSLTVRSNYAKSVGLHGVALWEMSSGDRITRG
ncbi:glycosyl hydrolase family 18 protein [Frondihabitans australicus]|uniref:Spore germination protein YaaH n=1 Tax=Frondihabitans australicus TaxID=386892 RepID=A0A495IJN4_9MICO|nr:glycosyl hydrolase family 18 protein [Frondihabitans australicus]RKR75628.1 spore germination protein YaaH [Frondihabitans australicus]